METDLKVDHSVYSAHLSASLQREQQTALMTDTIIQIQHHYSLHSEAACLSAIMHVNYHLS